MSARREELRRLRRERPRSRLVRASVLALCALTAWAWLGGGIEWGELVSGRRRANLARFLSADALPYPLRADGEGTLTAWAAEILSSRGYEALAATFWIAVLAIVLAGAFGALAAPFAARSLMSRDPFVAAAGAGVAGAGGDAGRGAPWRLVSGTTRFGLVLLRAIPEYLWAFLLLALLGPGAWPAVLALALHNAGILGRLGADTIENLDRAPLGALRGLGASRAQVTVAAVFPLTLPRFLLYFFYRFETCVREATVLGMLGVVSLGYFVQDARARQRYDEMIFLVALGALLVIAADLASMAARRWLRGAR